jgi:hypothetical protein
MWKKLKLFVLVAALNGQLAVLRWAEPTFFVEAVERLSKQWLSLTDSNVNRGRESSGTIW